MPTARTFFGAMLRHFEVKTVRRTISYLDGVWHTITTHPDHGMVGNAQMMLIEPATGRTRVVAHSWPSLSARTVPMNVSPLRRFCLEPM